MLFTCQSHGQFGPAEVSTLQSHSGQFVVMAPRTGLPSSASFPNSGTNNEVLRLDPGLTTVSCERIKDALWRQLGTGSGWKGRIHLVLHPAKSTDEAITIASDHYRDGWRYRVALPNVTGRTRFVRAIIQVLLLEYANRNSGSELAQPPLWLVEGLTRELLVANELQLTFQPPRLGAGGLLNTQKNINERRQDPLKDTRRELATRVPLTFEQLSWPTETQLEGDLDETYRSSSQLFVRELLRLKDGPMCVKATLTDLSKYQNWQFAFLQAFRNYFQQPVDVEKWWALRVAHYRGQDYGVSWTVEESWEKLNEAIHPSVMVRANTNDLPLKTQIQLQNIVRAWDMGHQMDALTVVIRGLGLARLKLAPEYAAIATQYQEVLTTYVGKMPVALPAYRSGKKPRLGKPVTEALDKLDELDARLEQLRPTGPALTNTQPPQ